MRLMKKQQLLLMTFTKFINWESKKYDISMFDFIFWKFYNKPGAVTLVLSTLTSSMGTEPAAHMCVTSSVDDKSRGVERFLKDFNLKKER